MIDDNAFEGEILDVEPFEGDPDYDMPQAIDAEGTQDENGGDLMLRQFAATNTEPIHSWEQVLQFFRINRENADFGFDLDGMCLKITRVARNIPARYLSAKEAQDATPQEHRIHKVEDLRAGMVAFSDDPNDSNRFGHVYTIIGRRRGFKRSDKAGVLTISNSVKANELVVVTLDYYERYWGDDFKFGATWLNGYELDTNQPQSRVEKFHNSAEVYDLNILARAAKAGRPAAQHALDEIERQIRLLPDNPRFVRVRNVKELHRRDRKLHMPMLDAAVADGRPPRVLEIRNELRRLIEALPDE